MSSVLMIRQLSRLRSLPTPDLWGEIEGRAASQPDTDSVTDVAVVEFVAAENGHRRNDGFARRQRNRTIAAGIGAVLLLGSGFGAALLVDRRGGVDVVSAPVEASWGNLSSHRLPGNGEDISVVAVDGSRTVAARRGATDFLIVEANGTGRTFRTQPIEDLLIAQRSVVVVGIDGAISIIATDSGASRSLGRIETGAAGVAMASDGRSVWITNKGDVQRIELASGAISTVPGTAGARDVVLADSTIFVAQDGDRFVSVDATSNTVLARRSVSGASLMTGAGNDAFAVVAAADGGGIVVYDRSITEVRRLPLVGRVQGLASDGSEVWTISDGVLAVQRLDGQGQPVLRAFDSEGTVIAASSQRLAIAGKGVLQVFGQAEDQRER